MQVCLRRVHRRVVAGGKFGHKVAKSSETLLGTVSAAGGHGFQATPTRQQAHASTGSAIPGVHLSRPRRRPRAIDWHRGTNRVVSRPRDNGVGGDHVGAHSPTARDESPLRILRATRHRRDNARRGRCWHHGTARAAVQPRASAGSAPLATDEPPSRALPQITSADRATRTEQNAQPVHRQCVQSTLSAVHWTHRFFNGGMWGVARRLDIRPEIRMAPRGRPKRPCASGSAGVAPRTRDPPAVTLHHDERAHVGHLRAAPRDPGHLDIARVHDSHGRRRRIGQGRARAVWITCMVFGKDKKYNNKYKKSCRTRHSSRHSYKVVGRRGPLFIRHGESLWNEVFNRGFHPIKFPLRLVKALCVSRRWRFKNDCSSSTRRSTSGWGERRTFADTSPTPKPRISLLVRCASAAARERALCRARQLDLAPRDADHRHRASPRRRRALSAFLTTESCPSRRRWGSHQAAQGGTAHPVPAARDLDERRHARPAGTRTAPELPSIEMQLELERDDDPFEPAHANVDANTGNKHVLSTDTRIVDPPSGRASATRRSRRRGPLSTSGNSSALSFARLRARFEKQKKSNGKPRARAPLGCLTPQRAQVERSPSIEQGDLGQR